MKNVPVKSTDRDIKLTENKRDEVSDIPHSSADIKDEKVVTSIGFRSSMLNLGIFKLSEQDDIVFEKHFGAYFDILNAVIANKIYEFDASVRPFDMVHYRLLSKDYNVFINAQKIITKFSNMDPLNMSNENLFILLNDVKKLIIENRNYIEQDH